MNLVSIQIRNYRSVEDVTFTVSPLDDGSLTYGLIGINEAGKSTFLKAIALKEVNNDGVGIVQVTPKDFKDKTKPIEVFMHYEFNKADWDNFQDYLNSQDPLILVSDAPKVIVIVHTTIDLATPSNRTTTIRTEEEGSDLELPYHTQLSEYVTKNIHRSIFWTAEDKYLISQPINLIDFAQSPEGVSVPLNNCFLLAGITNIRERISNLSGDSTELEQLQTELSEKVTEHIKKVWKNHPIKITFIIDSGHINFHVSDIGTKGKAKTADQRSDGFKQLVSFLLTISAQDRNEQLSNSILLLDEPETHLHPQAQEYLLKELINITRSDRNNLVFFATHSVFMIDKQDLSRNYRVSKIDDKTSLTVLDKKMSTYASVAYEVFDIVTTDYHNELYGRMHQSYQDEDPSDEDREKIKIFDEKYLCQQMKMKQKYPWKKKSNSATLPTYVRNSIHHPESRQKVNDEMIKESLEALLKIFNP